MASRTCVPQVSVFFSPDRPSNPLSSPRLRDPLAEPLRVELFDKACRNEAVLCSLAAVGYLCFDHIKPPFANQQWRPRITGAKLALMMDGKT